MLSSDSKVIMVSSGANVIIGCYHVMLSSGMITPPFFVFPGNFTHSIICIKCYWNLLKNFQNLYLHVRNVMRGEGAGIRQLHLNICQIWSWSNSQGFIAEQQHVFFSNCETEYLL
jgi:hypothetical protein